MATLRGSLVDWWDLDEASGDATGAHAGTVLTEVTTGAPIGTGTIGGRAARHFDPAEGHVLSCLDSQWLSFTDDQAFTVACRVQFDTVSFDPMAFVSKYGAQTYDRQFILACEGNVQFIVYDNSGSSQGEQVLDVSSLSANTPYTIIAWHDPDADTINVSINNASPTVGAYARGTHVLTETAPFQIGSAPGVTAFDGLIGSVVFAKRVWTAEERTLYYNSGAGLAYADLAQANLILPQITRDALSETSVSIVHTDVEAVELIALIDSGDLLDDTLTVLVSVLASDDGEVTWNHLLYEGTWSGGTTVDPATDLIAAMPWEAHAAIPPALRGLPLKMQITPSKSVSIGVEMWFEP